jgi:hypothetical protein
VGGAEAATGQTGSTQTGSAKEAETIGGRFESHSGSHEEAVGGLSESARIRGVSPVHEALGRSPVLLRLAHDFGKSGRIGYKSPRH